ncbi:hypothetical protein BDV40DRAFT_300007 [Aspergillus tamarii]|uniref:FAD/NAD(P)-binding domain-containing protein n=1 Tax=Aspergillus tamarii TaxID=41984 RepID=A0A5N6UWA8_ASPTM|nr:hypothetical protein BDV40DRAFT_300007 [Aspergillus tamarii]
MTPYNVLVIGGGPAGQSMSTGLACQLYGAVVFDFWFSTVFSATVASSVVVLLPGFWLLTPTGGLETMAPFYSTFVPSVFAAGDCISFVKIVATAKSSGELVAGGLFGQLQGELYPAEQQ